MRPASFLLTAAVMLAACDTATAPRSMQSSVDDSRVPPELRAAYLEDANRLALRDLLAKGFSEVPIPQDAVQPYYNALVLVHNATALPARDTVVDIYRIHTIGPPTRSLLLWLFGTETWVQRLAHGELPTGDPTVDTLLARYSLTVGSAYTMQSGDVLLTLVPPEPLNINALAGLFHAITGVRFAEPNSVIGAANDIGGSIAGERVALDYSVGYGDCPAGCIERRFYHFAVHDDGTVEYLGASGSPPPPGSP